MSETLVWWLMMQVVGLATLPLCLSLFSRLPDRGYALSKAFALIIIGYLLWVLNVAHILPNTPAGIWVIVLALFGISTLVFLRKREDFLDFWRRRWWLIAAVEVVLLLSFITAAYLRSYVGDLGGTEKPMDFMFLNAVTRADHFPPADPWMAGEKVAYYYFGYLIVSIMTRLSAIETSVGFNLGVAMIASLACAGAFGLVYNMTAPRAERELESGPGTPAAGFSSRVLWRPMIFGLSAAFLLTVIGNLEGLLEAIAAAGIGAKGFWSWVGISGLTNYNSVHWYPDNYWFWWRATRILDNSVGIHEFPFFSFLLGDLHPHVMSIPFVLLALGIAQLLLRYEGPLDLVVWLERPLWLLAFAVMVGGLAFINTWDMPTIAFVLTLMALLRNRLIADRWSWGLVADTAGFLLPLFVCALLAYSPFFFGGFDSQASGFKAVAGPIDPGSQLHSGSRLFQALLIWGTFAIIVLPYALWRIRSSSQPISTAAVLWSLAPGVAIVALWAFWNVLGVHVDDSGKLQSGFGIDHLLGWLPTPVRPSDAVNASGDVISLGGRIGNRGWNWLTALMLMGIVGLLAQALYREVEEAKRTGEERLGHIFALALSATAALLILGSEFFFILDTFNSRMNTIFKLYYQAWLMLSVAGGFVLFEIAQGWRAPAVSAAKTPTVTISAGAVPLGEVLVGAATLVGAITGLAIGQDAITRFVGLVIGGGVFFVVSGVSLLWWRSAPPGIVRAVDDAVAPAPAAATAAPAAVAAVATGQLTWRGVWAGAVVTILFAAFLYPLLATYNRTGGFNNRRVLDGLSLLPNEQRVAIDWLRDRDGHPVVVEAPGGDYTDFGTISAATGLPTIIQWKGHELQWRGSGEGLDEREQAVETIYTGTPDAVRSILQQYNVRFVVVGPKEREKYSNLAIEQMTDIFQVVKQEGEVTIYRVAPGILSQVSAGAIP